MLIIKVGHFGDRDPCETNDPTLNRNRISKLYELYPACPFRTSTSIVKPTNSELKTVTNVVGRFSQSNYPSQQKRDPNSGRPETEEKHVC
jgi:hypothetical protein